MENKRSNLKKLFIPILLLVIALTLIGLVIFFVVTPIGSNHNAKEIRVYDETIPYNESIVLPVKMKNGTWTPTHQSFHSDLSLTQLCELAKNYDNNVSYEIYDDKAYLYKTKNSNIVARVMLTKNNYKSGDLNYTMQNLYAEGIVFPLHLTKKFFDEPIVFNDITYSWYAIAFITPTDMVKWLSDLNLYSVELNSQNDTICCISKNSSSKTYIYFNGNIVAVKTIYE